MKSGKPTGKPTSWTNERHHHFLTSMEASFVRTMFESPRLDRFCPDSSDSTHDAKSPSICWRKKLVSSSSGQRTRKDINKITQRKTRNPYPSSRPNNSSQDQVVPQIEQIGEGDKDESTHPYDLNLNSSSTLLPVNEH